MLETPKAPSTLSVRLYVHCDASDNLGDNTMGNQQETNIHYTSYSVLVGSSETTRERSLLRPSYARISAIIY